jgi:probable HAF family extracellular repeat protein
MKYFLIAVLLCISSFVAQQASAAFLVPLARPPGADHFRFVQPNEVSADGSVVVGLACTDLNLCADFEAFRWTSGGGMVSLGAGHALDVSADGSVVVGGPDEYSLVPEAFRWTSEGGMVGLGDLPGGEFSSLATGVSADGSVVVGEGSTANGREAFRWTSEGGMVGLGGLGDLSDGEFISSAIDVSANGSVVVGSSRAAHGFEAFRWTSDGGMVGLGRLTESDKSVAYDVSADGSVVVGSSYTGECSCFQDSSEAFRWTSDGGMVGLGHLPGDHWSRAVDVSADGSVVFGRSASAPFLWDSTNGMRSVWEVLTDSGVDFTGWFLVDAFAMSDDGTTIVGWGANPFGGQEGWLANISAVPEPTSVQLFCIACYLIVIRSRARCWK